MIRLARFLQPYKLSLAAIVLLVFLQALSDLYLPTLMADIVDIGVVKGNTPYILMVGAFMLVVAIGGALCSIGASYMSSRVATSFGKIIRANLFSHVERYSLHEFDKFGSASLITRTTNDTTQVQQVYIIILRMMISAPLMAVGGIIMAVSKDAQLSLVLVCALPVLAIAIWIITGNGIPLFRVMQKKLDKINLILDENLTGMRVIRSLNRINHEQQRFQDANQDLTDVSIKVNRIMAAMWPVMMLIMNASSIAIVWFGGLRVAANDLQIGDLMAFLQYSTQIMFAMLMVSMMFIMIPRASASATRINEVLDVLPAMSDAEEVKQADERRGYVEFRNVTFSYPGAEQPAIEHISFNARPGEITAIIGGTGAGKSTLVNLIPRFYDIDSGGILVDGVDVREMTQEGLRAKIGLVPQKAVLFSGTVADNIRYGKEGASDEDVIHAAEVAQATEFVTGMADGYDSQIAQGGTNVSGGQKQRLSIARALIRQPEIYIFDDSFSALDFKTDARLRAALKGEIANSTVFIVAQRVSTVMDANQIIVLDEGKIAGVGTHRELMQSSNVYREIVSSQLSMEEIA
jgi:ATP-binding cassette, subfamily B, multidrug efflux pump